MLKKSLTARDFILEDCARMPNLLKKVWNLTTTEDYWQWKFLKPPFETKGIVIEDRDGNIVAFSSFWLRPTKFGGKTIFPGTLVDVMADQKYRGGRAFPILIRKIDSEIRAKRAFFGFPNPVAHKLFLRYFKKYITVDMNISAFVSVVNVGAYVRSNKAIKAFLGGISRTVHKLRLSFHCNKDILVQDVHDVGDEFDQLWNDIRGEYFWIQNRGKDFIRWRYLLDPTSKFQIWKATERGRIVGYLVTSIRMETGRTKGFLVDWLVSRKREDVFLEMVNTAFCWLANQKVDLVETWLMDHEKQWARILRYYFFIKNKKKRALLLSGGPDYLDPNFHKIENFFFTIGDSDYLGTIDV